LAAKSNWFAACDLVSTPLDEDEKLRKERKIQNRMILLSFRGFFFHGKLGVKG